MNKEQVYDAKISPLMQQVIALCRENGIAMMASFDLSHDGEGPNGEGCSRLTCNTLLPDDTGQHNPFFVEANAHIQRNGSPAPMMITTEHGDGSKTMTAVI